MEYSYEYYMARLSNERAMAEAAVDPAIAKIHQELADHYERLANEARSSRRASA